MQIPIHKIVAGVQVMSGTLDGKPGERDQFCQSHHDHGYEEKGNRSYRRTWWKNCDHRWMEIPQPMTRCYKFAAKTHMLACGMKAASLWLDNSIE